MTDQQETVTLVHDAKGNLLSQADSKGTTTYTYDAAGRLTGVASPGYPMTATYNEYGLCTSVTNPSSGTTTYIYNGFDELHTETDAKGNTTTYTYNASGLPTSKNDGTRSISYAYNNKGELVYNGYGGNHQIVYTYTDGLLTKEVKTIEGVSLTKQYTYDSKGRLDTYTSPSGLILKYSYNTVNDLSIITDNTTNTNLWEIRVYNEFGLIAMENGVGGRQTTYTYDQAGRPLTMSNNLASFTYTYNGGGQLTQRVENFGSTGLTETFAYDAGGCLTSSTLQGKTPVTVSYNSGRGITNKSDVGTYSYASNGAPLASINRVSSYNPGAQSITYNSSNLPASITQGGYTRTYTYDVNDQRDYSVLTKSNSSLPFAAGKRYYFGDFERNINTENNAVTDIDYIFADGRLVALVKTTGGTKTTYGAMTDRQGSLRALYNGSGLVQSFSYDAWGNRRNPSTGAALTASELVAANSITSRGYTCHEHMDEFGLINMNARIYDPSLGMFISVDPLAQEYYDTYPYAYCGGDPVNAVDPTGKSTWWTTDDPEQIEAYWAWFSQIGGGNTGSYNFGNANWGSSSFTFEEYQEAIQEGKGITHLIHDRELGHIPMMDPEPEGKLGKAVAVAMTLSVSDGPIPVGELIGASVIARAAIHDITQRIYVTYTLTRPDGKIYIGRSSGYGDPYSIVLRRFYSHHRRVEGYNNPQLDRYAKGPSGYAAIRGREQQLIDYYGGIGSPNVGNIIRGVSRYNFSGHYYHFMSNLYFGNIAPYTGF